MCGIAGIISLRDHQPPKALLDKMVASMNHRGPDAKGTHVHPSLGGLGHARLSIIDTSSISDQPFEANGQVLCFNGEIFNYIELREELEHLGHQFRTNSDTEVLLAAYRQWEDKCVHRLNGMWAFAILDPAKKRVFCSRDRFGIKPFLYAKTDSFLYFASEAKAILAADSRFKQPNFAAISLLLRASIGGQNPDTCFAGIHRLLPAHNLIIENGEISISRYWDYPNSQDHSEHSNFDQVVEEFEFLLKDAVKLRLRSDVPVGFTLSGGLDSSAIVCLSNSCGHSGLRTYTATYDHANYRSDESETAKLVAHKNKMEFIPVPIGPEDLLPTMRESVVHLEAPHAAVPILPYWKIMEEAKKDVKVILEGQGADELLAGYSTATTWPALLDDLTQCRFRSALARCRSVLTGAYGYRPTTFAMHLLRTTVPQLHRTYRRYRGDEGAYINELYQHNADAFVIRKATQEKGRLNRDLRVSHENGLVNLLQYSDAIPMAHSIESRLPFMDYRIVELASKMPGQFKSDSGWSKFVLRKSVDKYVPRKITWERSKRGFDSPVGVWFQEHMDTIVKPVLFSKECRARQLFDSNRIASLLKAHQAGQKDFRSQIYRWIMTELWFQAFID